MHFYWTEDLYGVYAGPALSISPSTRVPKIFVQITYFDLLIFLAGPGDQLSFATALTFPFSISACKN